VHVWGTEQVYNGYCRRDLRKRKHLENLDVDGRIILNWILKKWIREAWTGLLWLRTRKVGGHLLIR
jgi:hypothetical protein